MSSILRREKQRYRLPDVIGPQPPLGAQDVDMNVKRQIAPEGMDGGHDSGQGRVLPAARAHRFQGRLGGGAGHRVEQHAVVKQERAQLRRHGEREMAMPHVEQAALSMGGRLGGAGLAAGRTAAALAGEADRMERLADQTTVTDEAIGQGTTAQGFLHGRARRRSDRWREPPRQQRFHPWPMLPQNGLQQAGRLLLHTPFDTVACLKWPYFS